MKIGALISANKEELSASRSMLDKLQAEKDRAQQEFFDVHMEYRNLQAQKYKLDSKSKTLAQEQAAMTNSKGDGSANL
jgi:predicted  nucleic acid-binding Zn-ribbon protein